MALTRGHPTELVTVQASTALSFNWDAGSTAPSEGDMSRLKRTPVPTYHNQVPDELATLDQLDADGLQAGTALPVALVELVSPNSTRLTGLYERALAKPKAAYPKEPA